MISFFTKSQTKILSAVLIALLFAPTFSYAFSIPLPTTDPLPPVPTSDSAERTKNVGLTIAGITIPGVTLDSLAVAFMRGMLTQLTNTTVKYINNGFHAGQSGPQYAVDLKGYLQDAADAAAGNIIQSADPGLCSPFHSVVTIALKTAQAAVSQRNQQPIVTSCRLSQVSSNIDNFLKGDIIGSGGWNAWFTMTQDPDGNPYSSFLNVQASSNNAIVNALNVQDQQLSWNKGFLSSQDCTKYVQLSGADLGSIADADSDAGVQEQDLSAGASLPDGAKCTEYGPVKTPGDVIEGQLEKVFGSQVDQLNLSNDFNDILLALIGQLENTVFNKAKGIFDSDPYSNTFTGGSGGNGATGFCTPSATTYAIGDPKPITWSYAGSSEGATFVWSDGDSSSHDLNGTTSQNPMVFYTTEGTKDAKVQITQSLDGHSTTTVTTSCVGSVVVSAYPPLKLSCDASLDPQGNTPVPQRISPNTPVWWTIRISGGSGKLDDVNIDEDPSLNVTAQNTGSNYAPGQSEAQWNRVGKDAILPSALVGYFTDFNESTDVTHVGALPVYEGTTLNPDFSFQGDPLPLIKDTTSGTISFKFPVVYSQVGEWPMKFQEIVDHDVNVPILKNASCDPREVTVH